MLKYKERRKERNEGLNVGVDSLYIVNLNTVARLQTWNYYFLLDKTFFAKSTKDQSEYIWPLSGLVSLIISLLEDIAERKVVSYWKYIIYCNFLSDRSLKWFHRIEIITFSNNSAYYEIYCKAHREKWSTNTVSCSPEVGIIHLEYIIIIMILWILNQRI